MEHSTAELRVGSAAHLERQEREGVFAPGAKKVGIAFQGCVQGGEQGQAMRYCPLESVY